MHAYTHTHTERNTFAVKGKRSKYRKLYFFSADLFYSGLTAKMLPIPWNMDCKAITLLNYFLLARQAKPAI